MPRFWLFKLRKLIQNSTYEVLLDGVKGKLRQSTRYIALTSS